MSAAAKRTLTPQEHARVDATMGSLAAGGHRVCRCGAHVRWTPSDLWAHALACEREQETLTHAERGAA